jgi:hypothetical protein
MQHGALCKEITKLLLLDFEEHSPLLPITKYKVLLVKGMSSYFIYFFFSIFIFLSSFFFLHTYRQRMMQAAGVQGHSQYQQVHAQQQQAACRHGDPLGEVIQVLVQLDLRWL